MKCTPSLALGLLGLVAQVTANDNHDADRRQNRPIPIPTQPTSEASYRLSILPVSMSPPPSSSNEPPTTIGRITGSDPRPTGTSTSQAPTTATTTPAQTHVSTGAAAALPAPTLAHYLAGMVALAGLGMAAV